MKQYFLFTENLGLEILGVPAWGIRAKVCNRLYFFHKYSLVINSDILVMNLRS